MSKSRKNIRPMDTTDDDALDAVADHKAESASEAEDSSAEENEAPMTMIKALKIKAEAKRQHHTKLCVSTSYLNVLYKSKLLDKWLYYLPGKGTHIIANLNSRLIRGRKRDGTKPAEPTIYMREELLFRCVDNTYVFLTQDPAKQLVNPFIQTSDDFITKFLGFSDSKDELQALAESRDLANLCGKEVEEKSQKAFEQLQARTVSPVGSSVTGKRKRSSKKSAGNPKSKRPKIDPSATLESAEINDAKLAGQAAAVVEEKGVNLSKCVDAFFSGKTKSKLFKLLDKRALLATEFQPLNSVPSAMDLSDDSVALQSVAAREDRLAHEAKLEFKMLSYLNPNSWKVMSNGNLELNEKHSFPRTAQLLQEAIQEFCDKLEIDLQSLQFFAVDGAIQCGSFIKHSIKPRNHLSDIYQQAQERLKIKFNAEFRVAEDERFSLSL